MMHCKKKKIIAAFFAAAAAATMIIAAYLIYDVNRRFPEPEVYTYTSAAPAYEDGLEITPVDFHVYTYEEYIGVFGESGTHSDNGEYYKENGDSFIRRYAVFTVEYENVSDKDVIYDTRTLNMYGERSNLVNGLLMEEGKKEKSTLKPGEKEQFTLTGLVASPTIVGDKWIDKLDEETFYVSISWYPEMRRLAFRVSDWN